MKAVLHTVSKPAGYCCSNRGRFSNVLFDEKLEQSYLTVDRAAREKLLQEAMAIAVKEVGIIPLHSQVNTWATRKGLVYEARTDETTLAQSTSKAN